MIMRRCSFLIFMDFLRDALTLRACVTTPIVGTW